MTSAAATAAPGQITPARPSHRRAKRRRPHRSGTPRRVPGHVLRHVHGVPGHPGGVGFAVGDPGRPRRVERRDHLGADRLSDGRSGRHSALRLSFARARHAHHVRHRGRGFHDRQPDVRTDLVHGADDRLARDPGLYRRRHGADRVRLRLHHLSALAHARGRTDDRARGDFGADHRPDRRRLSHRRTVVALAVFHQHRARHHGDDRGARP